MKQGWKVWGLGDDRIVERQPVKVGRLHDGSQVGSPSASIASNITEIAARVGLTRQTVLRIKSDTESAYNRVGRWDGQ